MNEMILANTDTYSVRKPSENYLFLTFKVDEETFGVDINEVKEIIEVTAITKVPMAPSFISGVINLRGSVVPVINLAARLGFEHSRLNKRTCIVLIELKADEDSSAQTIGMMVDQVNEIIEIKTEDLQPVPTFGVDIRVDFINGMGKVGNNFIVLLNMNKVLSIAELSQISKAVKSLNKLTQSSPDETESTPEDFDF